MGDGLFALSLGLLVAIAGVLLWNRWVIRSSTATDPDRGAWLRALEFGLRRIWARALPGQAERWLRWGLQAHHPAQAWACLEEAARRGHADAHFELGLYFEEGGLGAGGRAAAAEHYRRAAELGHAEAAFRLAELLRWGIGPAREAQAAHRWHLRSAHRGFGPAMAWLAEAYAKGDGVEADEAEACRWRERADALPLMPGLRHSVIAGNPPPRDPLVRAGRALRGGWDEGLDALGRQRAFQAFSRLSAWLAVGLLTLLAAALLFLAFTGPFMLAALVALPGLLMLHLKLRRGTRWGRGALRMEAAARRGEPEACLRLGMSFLEGRHPYPKDPHAGKDWIQRAAEAGHTEAMFRLGELLTWNVAGPRDPAAAEAWLRRAAAAGHGAARARLDRMASRADDGGAEGCA